MLDGLLIHERLVSLYLVKVPKATVLTGCQPETGSGKPTSSFR
jgi:hypothetical protein